VVHTVVVDAKRIDVLSDSTGETAEKVVRAAMLQFPHSGAQIRLHTRVRTKEAARPILERALRHGPGLPRHLAGQRHRQRPFARADQVNLDQAYSAFA